MAISIKDMFKDMFSSQSADRVFVTVEDVEHYIEESKKKPHFKCGIPLEQSRAEQSRVMFSGIDESDEKETAIKILTRLTRQIVELQEDIRIKDRLLSELQVPAKWYDNIPEQGVLGNLNRGES